MPVTIPNLITMFRFCLVPFGVWCIAAGEWRWAFWTFVTAGVSDGVDGFIAKRFNQRSRIGAVLDPLADKALLMSITIALGIVGVLPAWFVILVVFRDVMIIGAILVAWLVAKPLDIAPSKISKANTAAQIAFVAVILFLRAFNIGMVEVVAGGTVLVAVLTVASTAPYLRQWLRHMAG